MSYRLGIDVGGTFTDFLLLGDDDAAGAQDELDARRPVARLRARARGDRRPARLSTSASFMASIELIVHGTTVSTNAVLTGSGALTGALMTEGFRDTLRLRDGMRATPYDNHLTPPRPLAAARAHLRHRASGSDPRARCDARSTRQAVRDAAATLRADGVEAVAISFLHSPQNDGARAARRARSSPSELPGRLRHGVQRGAAADPLLRPRTSTTGAQRLRRADHQPLHGRADRAPRRLRLRRRAADHAVERRRRHAGRGVAPRRAVAAVGPGRRAGRRPRAPSPRRHRRLHHRRHGRHELRRRDGQGRAAGRR